MSEIWKMVSFRFSVFLSNGLLLITPELKDKILEWYYEYGRNNADSVGMLDSQFVFVDSNIIECSYIIKKDDFENHLCRGFIKSYHEVIADPDYDGNYPLNIDEININIKGKLIDTLFSVSTKTSL